MRRILVLLMAMAVASTACAAEGGADEDTATDPVDRVTTAPAQDVADEVTATEPVDAVTSEPVEDGPGADGAGVPAGLLRADALAEGLGISLSDPDVLHFEETGLPPICGFTVDVVGENEAWQSSATPLEDRATYRNSAITNLHRWDESGPARTSFDRMRDGAAACDGFVYFGLRVTDTAFTELGLGEESIRLTGRILESDPVGGLPSETLERPGRWCEGHVRQGPLVGTVALILPADRLDGAACDTAIQLVAARIAD